MLNTNDDLNYTSRLLVGVSRDSAVQAMPRKRARTASRLADRATPQPTPIKKTTGKSDWFARLATWMTRQGPRTTGMPDQAA